MDNKILFDLYQKRWELIGHIQANADNLEMLDEVREMFNGVMKDSASIQMVENKLINEMKDDIEEQRKSSKQLDLMLVHSMATGNVLDFKENMMLRK
ncbi:hypothetical protein N9R04_07205 [Staphylococcus sp. SQ8-PEA]|uniref:Phage protein n=1 Tax=Staphylococcus marylandisciuri TaxID=2981529 RepID=A0ABT2QR91_9STAP|nr:hypothetical protein [Staphylococcus marylandisciuri]MCU5746505.1 hypothetical protein [Staphylococcus marylandisciuri]